MAILRQSTREQASQIQLQSLPMAAALICTSTARKLIVLVMVPIVRDTSVSLPMLRTMQQLSPIRMRGYGRLDDCVLVAMFHVKHQDIEGREFYQVLLGYALT